MKHHLFKRSLIASALALPLMTHAVDVAPQQNEEQRFIVTFKQSDVTPAIGNEILLHATPSQLDLFQATAQSVNAEIVQHMPSVNAMAVLLNAEQKQQILNDKNVASVEVDPKRYLYAETTPYGITMVQAPQLSDDGSVNQKVCIMDTGYHRSHPDLVSAGVTGDDGYGQHDTGNWYNDGNGHGTHVAGTIAAIGGNGQGVVGVNPSGKLGLHIVKVFDDNGQWAYGSDLIQAISQCRAAGSTVISMSLGGSGSSTAESQAFQNAYNAGVLNVAAAGNNGDSSMSYPASYDSVMSVAAVDSSGNKASFSQYNSQVEIAAPGVNVNSTYNNGGYRSLSGTSMATPHVSGVAALVWGNNPRCTVQQIRDGLNATAEDRGASGRDTSYGYGIVKAKAAHDHLQNICGDEPPFGANFSVVTEKLRATFTDRSTGGSAIVSRAWDFGDGNSSSSTNPVHTYGSAGTYQVTLTITDNQGKNDSETKSVTVTTTTECPNPWSADKYYTIGDEVSYEGYNYESIWWSLGARPDLYPQVWKKLDDCDGTGPGENDPPEASFSHSVTDLTVSFNNTSTDDKAVVRSMWNFGDGITSDERSPTHTYGSNGVYSVSLTVYDEEGLSHTTSKQVDLTGDIDCNAPAWTPTKIYVGGDEVSQNGNRYRARWWNINQSPAENSGPWDVWELIGSCR